MTRVLTDACANEMRAVLKAGGASEPLALAFRKLGELAMQELMADKSVKAYMSGFERDLDRERFEALRKGN